MTSPDSSTRYARHLSLPQFGTAGQQKLTDAKVLVVGAGGLGSPLLMYLAAAGIGTLGLIDADRVAFSNLQRQVLYETADIDRPKTLAATDRLTELNPDIQIIAYNQRLDDSNAAQFISEFDLIADGSDNFETRLIVNKYCVELNKTLVSAAVIGFSAQLYSFKGHLGAPHPCYQCLCPEAPPANTLPDCSDSGVLGSLAGMMGCWQATEVIKELLGIGHSLSGEMRVINALEATVRTIKIKRDPECPVCSKA